MLRQQLDELDATDNNDNTVAVTEELDALHGIAAVASEASESAGFHEGGHNNMIIRFHCVKKCITIKHSVFGTVELANPRKFY